MCGIGGIVIHSGGPVSVDGLKRMGRAMAMRGPDDEGHFIDAGIGLIHRRLSIRDLSVLGNCPMPNEDGSIQVLLNGEIYNWRQLRADLLDRGHNFRSMSDSEVVSHGYEEWGETLFSRLRGMFALAIWDGARSKLLLARDRVGEKPLFIMSRGEQTLFASSLNAIRAYDETALPIDHDAIACCLSHNFIPSTHTVWRGIAVFPPAHYCVIENGTSLYRRYWSFSNEQARAWSVASAEVEVERVVDESVQRCLDADVPVGVFLSGGVDSSLVAALAARHHRRLNSFTVAFDEGKWSESRCARKVAAHLNLRHHETIIRQTDVLKILPHLVFQYGQPFGDASAVPTYILSRFARQDVTVCLSGDGGDESFAGYWRVRAGVYAARYGTLVPEVVRSNLIPALASRLGKLGTRLAAMNTLSLETPGVAYTNSESWYSNLEELAGPTLRPGLAHDRVACRIGHTNDRAATTVIQRLLLTDFQVQLPDAYLTKVDVASMAASLEVRAPLLDVSVLETAWGLPDRMKLNWSRPKWLLKRIAARLVPPEVIYRRKMGFSMPLASWFRADIGRTLGHLLRNSVAAREGWIDSERALHELEVHRSGRCDNHTRLWSILWLELWFRIILTGEMKPDDDLSTMCT